MRELGRSQVTEEATKIRIIFGAGSPKC